MKSASNPQATTVAGNGALDNRNALMLTLAGLEQGLATGRMSNEHILPALQTAKYNWLPMRNTRPDHESTLRNTSPPMAGAFRKTERAHPTQADRVCPGTDKSLECLRSHYPNEPPDKCRKNQIQKDCVGYGRGVSRCAQRAKKRAEECVFGLTGIHVDADRTYLNRFNSSQSGQTYRLRNT